MTITLRKVIIGFLLAQVCVVLGTGYYLIEYTKSSDPRKILEQFTKSLEVEQIEHIEVLYCPQFNQTTARGWHDFEFHSAAKPGAKTDEESGCRRTIVNFGLGRKPRGFPDDNVQIRMAETLRYTLVNKSADGSGLPAKAAAYFYERGSHKVYVLYFEGKNVVNGIASMFFVNGEWLIDQSYYVSLKNDSISNYIFDNYITGKLDVPVKQ
jgi:hypothetical protein